MGGENVIFYVEIKSPFRRIFFYVSLEVRNPTRDSVSSTFHYFKISQDNFTLLMVGFASRVYGWKNLKSLLLSAFQVCLCIGLVVCLFVCLFVCLSLLFRVSSTNQ